MKRLRFGLLLLVIAGIVYAQAPNAFNYQAVLRNTDGTIKANETVTLQIGLIDDNGLSYYMEMHNTQTSEQGLINVVIGEGMTSEDISIIDWSARLYYLDITVNGVNLGSSPLLSVPYAMYAGTANSVTSLSWDELENTPNSLEGYELDYVESRVANLESAISALTSGLTLCNGTFIDLQTDPQNCGDCDISCDSGFKCINGICVLDCQDGFIEINGLCIDPLNDDRYCGASSSDQGTTCPDGYSCLNGECVDITPDNDQDGWTVAAGDCDDSDPNINPEATEICDGEDNDCNSSTSAPGEVDLDNDGYLACVDCDDSNSLIHPGAAEICDGIDNNCNNLIDQADIANSTLCPPKSRVTATSCSGALGCIVSGCQTGWYDMDGIYENGCECQITGLENNSFGTATYLGQISDQGGAKGASGVLIPGDYAYYRIHVEDNFSGIFNPQLQILSNNSHYSFTAYHQNFNVIGTIPAGSLDLSSETPISDDSEDFYIRVYRSSSTQSCEDFSFRIFED